MEKTEMSKPKLGSIYQRTKKLPDGTKIALPTYWIKYYVKGKPVRESSKSERSGDAETLLKRRLGEIVTGKFSGLGPERITFEELAQDVVADYRENDKSSLG